MSREQEPAKLLIPREEAKARLEDRIQKGEDILEEEVGSANSLFDMENLRNSYYRWSGFNDDLLRRIFDNDQYYNEYQDVVFVELETPREVHRKVHGDLNKLQSILDRLELMPVSSSLSSPENKTGESVELGSDVFVVHGHDHDASDTVARFIERLGLKPIILREQPNRGRTIIEKFEDYSNVGFAVVLMTPDDLGALASERERLKPRARQNVVFELGFFIGKLGRERVCVLYEQDVEIPSDYDGVVYVPKDERGAWKQDLAKELNAAGIPVDMNKMME